MSSNPDKSYSVLNDEVNELMKDLVQDESNYIPQRPAEELFNLPDSVQIFFIRNDGTVTTFSEPATVRIFAIDEEVEGQDWKPIFIQVSGWTHPLIPGASPVLEAHNGAIMFPDVYADDDKTSAIGLVLTDKVTKEAKDQLLSLLETYTALKKRDQNIDNEHHLGKLGLAILKSAKLISLGLEKGTEKATELIDYVGEKQRSSASETPSSNTHVNSAIKVTAKGAKHATHAAVKVSGFISKRVGKLTKGLAKHLADKAAPVIVGSGNAASGTGGVTKSSSIQTIIDAARGGLLAYGTVYESLESSSKTLGNSLKDNTIKVVEIKYGDETSQVCDDSLTAAGNAAITFLNVQSLGIKGLIKKTAKNTGKEFGKNLIHGMGDKKS